MNRVLDLIAGECLAEAALVVLGACLYELPTVSGDGLNPGVGLVLLGISVALVMGYQALTLLLPPVRVAAN